MGSYTDTLPAGQGWHGPSVLECGSDPIQPASPFVATGFSDPIQTNDWWSSRVWKADKTYQDSPGHCVQHVFGENLYPHPWGIQFLAGEQQMQMGYPNYFNINTQYQNTWRVFQSGEGLDFNLTFRDSSGAAARPVDNRLQRYSDWDVTALSDDGSGHSWKTTMVEEGSPFVFFETTGIQQVDFGKMGISPTLPLTQTINNTVLGWTHVLEQDSSVEMTPSQVTHHFGFFTTGTASIEKINADWTTFRIKDLPASGGYFAFVILPDADPATLEFYRKRAYALPTKSEVSWDFDSARLPGHDHLHGDH